MFWHELLRSWLNLLSKTFFGFMNVISNSDRYVAAVPIVGIVRSSPFVFYTEIPFEFGLSVTNIHFIIINV